MEFILTISGLFRLSCNVCKFWNSSFVTSWMSACNLEEMCFVLRCEVIEKSDSLAWFNCWARNFQLINNKTCLSLIISLLDDLACVLVFYNFDFFYPLDEWAITWMFSVWCELLWLCMLKYSNLPSPGNCC